MGSALLDSTVIVFSGIVNRDIDMYTVAMVATVISGLIIALYNVIAGISVYIPIIESRGNRK